uniref:Uncharacterized protein n=2 Tax=viral metagenome TaxID=1070528 RepID=A0A6M3XWF4_9ZZZZ
MQKTLGWIMLLAGMFLLVSPYLMATLIIDTSPPAIWGHNPSSISPDTPSPIWGSLMIYIDLKDASGIASATVKITGSDGYSATFNMAYSSTVEYGNPQNPIICERWQYTWAVPAKNDVAYSFLCIAKDPLGNTGSKTLYGYATTAVDGYFMINDQKVTVESRITLATRTVTFKFVATSGAATIINVNVDIKKDGTIINAGYLAKQADGITWIRTYTFTEDGTFTVNGYFYTTGQSYQRMSVFCQIGEGDLELPQLNMLQMLGLASAGIGLALIFTGKKH